jgi:tryptophan synthase alpha chain
MNRIDKLFKEKKAPVLSVYFTAGYPKLNDTILVIKELVENDVDMIEIGMPFSDPLADGPIIQQSSQVALENGMSIRLLFQQLKGIRQTTSIPLILMGYLNPVMQFGIKEFCVACQETGIDAVILPDLPLQEYVESYQSIFEEHGIYNIFLITPQTNENRIRQIDQAGKGFIYMVSSSSTTGVKGEFAQTQIEYFDRIQKMNLKNPRMIGFGISDAKTYSLAAQYAQGAIIGSAFIKAISEQDSMADNIKKFMEGIKG